MLDILLHGETKEQGPRLSSTRNWIFPCRPDCEGPARNVTQVSHKSPPRPTPTSTCLVSFSFEVGAVFRGERDAKEWRINKRKEYGREKRTKYTERQTD
jgi:hypothetical protein